MKIMVGKGRGSCNMAATMNVRPIGTRIIN